MNYKEVYDRNGHSIGYVIPSFEGECYESSFWGPKFEYNNSNTHHQEREKTVKKAIALDPKAIGQSHQGYLIYPVSITEEEISLDREKVIEEKRKKGEKPVFYNN